MGASMQKSTKSKRGRRKSALMAEINVTPFVDVMLVLLIIFMVAAPLMTAGVPVDLPKSKAKALQQDNDEPILVSIKTNGEVFLGEQKVADNRLVPLLMAMSEGNKEKRIYVRGDSKLTYGQIMSIMGQINEAGFQKVALVSESK